MGGIALDYQTPTVFYDLHAFLVPVTHPKLETVMYSYKYLPLLPHHVYIALDASYLFTVVA